MIPESNSTHSDGAGAAQRARACVLFVDDERRVLTSMRAMFRRDYDVVLANSAVEALEVLQERAVHVVVSDQRMPFMTGVQLLTRIRQKRPETMRILLTGYADLDAIEASINESEVFRYLMKPCPPDELKTAVQLAVDAALTAGESDNAEVQPVVVTPPQEAIQARGDTPNGAVVLFAPRVGEPATRRASPIGAEHEDEALDADLPSAECQGANATALEVADATAPQNAAATSLQSADARRPSYPEDPAAALMMAFEVLANEAGVGEQGMDLLLRELDVFPPATENSPRAELIEAREIDAKEVDTKKVDIDADDAARIDTPPAAADDNVPTLDTPVPPPEVLVLSQDLQLVDSIRGAAGDEYNVVHAEVTDLAVQLLGTRPVGVLVTDLATDESGLAELTGTLKREVPELVTIIVSERSDATTMINLINHGQIFRFLLKPLQEVQTQIWLRSAVARFKSLCSDERRLLRHRVENDQALPQTEERAGLFAGLKRRIARFRVGLGAAIAGRRVPVRAEPTITHAETTSEEQL